MPYSHPSARGPTVRPLASEYEWRFDARRRRRQRHLGPRARPTCSRAPTTSRLRARRRARAGTPTRSSHDGLALDTGFLVHNGRNYPLLTRLFGELGVAPQHVGHVLLGQLQPLRPRVLGTAAVRRSRATRARPAIPRRSCGEIGRWLRTARRSLEGATTSAARSTEYAATATGYSARFRDHFLVPLTSALWSTAPGRALDFPAAYAIRFFENHGMLGLRPLPLADGRGRQPPLRRRDRSSASATACTSARRARAPARRRRGRPAHRRRHVHRFDHVVVATHADQALALLEDPSPTSGGVLGRFALRPQRGRAAHRRAASCPGHRAARASWNYRWRGRPSPTITYHLNRLQALADGRHYCVTLNRAEVDPEHVLARFTFAHPLYTVATLDAQRAAAASRRRARTLYAGAYHGIRLPRGRPRVAASRPPRALGVAW